MPYIDPVKFTTTDRYGCGPRDEDDVYTVAEFIDYDGFGYPVKDKLADPYIEIKPSKRKLIPKDATHIVWYNR